MFIFDAAKCNCMENQQDIEKLTAGVWIIVANAIAATAVSSRQSGRVGWSEEQ